MSCGCRSTPTPEQQPTLSLTKFIIIFGKFLGLFEAVFFLSVCPLLKYHQVIFYIFYTCFYLYIFYFVPLAKFVVVTAHKNTRHNETVWLVSTLFAHNRLVVVADDVVFFVEGRNCALLALPIPRLKCAAGQSTLNTYKNRFCISELMFMPTVIAKVNTI